jgi:hypothetical protein
MSVELAWTPKNVVHWLRASWPNDHISAAHARCLALVICTWGHGCLSEGALELEWTGDWNTGRVRLDLTVDQP